MKEQIRTIIEHCKIFGAKEKHERIKISNKLEDNYFEMKLIGAGSYAQVFKLI